MHTGNWLQRMRRSVNVSPPSSKSSPPSASSGVLLAVCGSIAGRGAVLASVVTGGRTRFNLLHGCNIHQLVFLYAGLCRKPVSLLGYIQVDHVGRLQLVERHRGVVHIHDLTRPRVEFYVRDKAIITCLVPDGEVNRAVAVDTFEVRRKTCPLYAVVHDDILARTGQTWILASHIRVPLEVGAGSLVNLRGRKWYGLLCAHGAGNDEAE